MRLYSSNVAVFMQNSLFIEPHCLEFGEEECGDNAGKIISQFIGESNYRIKIARVTLFLLFKILIIALFT